MPRITDVLERESRTVDLEPGDFERLLSRRDRKQRNRRIRAGALGLLVTLALGSFFARSLMSEEIPADRDPQPPSGQVLDLTATIGGAVEVSSPRDWFLVDHWPATDSEIHPPYEEPLVLFEVANFDPGLENAICPVEPGESRPLPADGIVVSVTLGPASDAAGRCAGTIEEVRTGTTPTNGISYTVAVVAGPDVSDRDRATAAGILGSIEPAGEFAFFRTGQGHPAYVLEAWSDRTTTWTLEAQPSNGNVELTLRQIDGQSTGEGGSIEVSGSKPVEAPGGGYAGFGSVTDEVARMELHLPGIDEPFAAERIELPASLDAGFDAFVFVPQQEGPYEVVAYAADGEVLFSSLPPLTQTERVGTVRAFGTTWAVKVSTSADGYWGAPCVEPAETNTQDLCERGWGDGPLVQTFDAPVPAVFVTVGQGVDAVDVVTDDGRRFPAVLVPTGGGGSVAVVALEGAGEGRFVYHYDGKVDESRRGVVDWSDVGQVIGDVRIIEP